MSSMMEDDVGKDDQSERTNGGLGVVVEEVEG